MTTTRDARPAAAGGAQSKKTSPLRDTFGIVVPSALPLLDEREVLLLRFLGRLEMMTLTQIHQAIYPSYSVRGVQHRLQYLLDDDLLWRVQTRAVAANHAAEYTRVRKQGAFAYGLSHQGKELLNTLEVEQEPLTFERLVSRDSKGRKPDLRTLSHDLQVSWWCLNVIMAAAQNRACRKIYVQTEFYPEKSQRIDALIILRLNPDNPRPVEDVGPIPFFDGTERRDGEIDIRLALEVDKGTEELKVLLEKAEKYRDLHKAGIYSATLGGPVLPVFLVQTPRRAAQIAREYQDVWPTGWGVAGTPFSVNSRDSVLWGKYKSLTTSQPFDLLTNMVVDAHGRVQFFPTMSREEWRQGVVTREIPLTAQQENGRVGGLERGRRARVRRSSQAAE
jgi:Replication-relaxation